MVNILFISNNDKLISLVKIFQERVKVKLDVAHDFDLGLKEVFEKRPAFVFIQDHIAGVAGESVARHIQMLLGSSAPQFVLLHDGAQKLKPVKSLYEHMLDLSSPESKILSDFQGLLQLLLGAHWQKIYIPQTAAPSPPITREVTPLATQEIANRLVDDLLSDLDTREAASTLNTAPLQDFSDNTSQDQFQIVSSPHDQLADLLIETAKFESAKEHPVANNSHAGTFNGEFSWEVPDTAVSVPQTTDLDRGEQICTPQGQSLTVSSPASDSSSTVSDDSVAMSPVIPVSAVGSQSAPQRSPADFFIAKESALSSAHEESLPASFRVTYDSSQSNRRTPLVILIIVTCSLCAVWMLYARGLLTAPLAITSSFLKQRKQVSSQARPQQPMDVVSNVSSAGLPTFVPVGGHDPAYSSGKPGWERYAGSSFEVRLFRQNGVLKVVQVIAAPERSISEPLMSSILNELVGESSFNETSQELKHGFQVSHATAAHNTELLVYRKQKLIHAVVISLE